MCIFLHIGFLYLVGKEPTEYLRRPSTINVINLLSEQKQLPTDQIVRTFRTGPFRGTWINRDLAINLSMYCDKTGALQLAVSRAIRALADRPAAAAAAAAPPPVESFSVYQQLHVKEMDVALNERDAAAKERVVAAKKRDLSLTEKLLAAKQRDYRVEEKHSAEMGNIKEKATAAQAQKTAENDNQDQLRSAASRMPDYWSSRDPCNRGVNGSHSTSNPAPARTTRAERVAAGTFILADAAEKAAVQLGVPAFEVKRFMGSSQGGYTMYQTVIKREKLENKGYTITHSVKFGWNNTGMYCASKMNAAVNWIKNNYN